MDAGENRFTIACPEGGTIVTIRLRFAPRYRHIGQRVRVQAGTGLQVGIEQGDVPVYDVAIAGEGMVVATAPEGHVEQACRLPCHAGVQGQHEVSAPQQGFQVAVAIGEGPPVGGQRHELWEQREKEEKEGEGRGQYEHDCRFQRGP